MTANKTGNGVSIIVCTNRPQFFDNILQNYNRQRYKAKELIIILNHDSMNLQLYQNRVRKHANVSVYQVPESISLGQSLNAGITRAQFPLIAKFDDDDYYSPFYLKEQVNGLRRTKSDIVGKHSCLVYLGASKTLLVRSPKEKNKYVEFIQGGTLLFKREILKKVRFTDRSIGEDVTFLRQCRKRGFKTYATSPYNYVYHRRQNKKSHTWRADDSFYLEGSKRLAVTENFRSYADKEL
ncbi:glycosyltransferase family A protein [Paenibacillus taichungensis]|uniref:Glycosyltransferase n=1 Tax=Paenibacillus taichungensis TaxID=484184 RepID=A0ABX2MR63_9BACL|nr:MULTISPECIES: glycosyltransferase family A protein [Paenibacillus]OME83268.1 glycosyl transferase family 2 [Paenibacillus pabuli]MDR9745614.1 glycosyltransferase family A protein [Paenibacillus taichungensis]MEC0105912.1 glycosyltransferase family A protein [Paenibacillus taichungensis]MEC0196601.1 glycosyltransferase family A protein [Paenibacillus taichungensis]NUU56510.1 glycosyltransferase [Paenibacillus taichungensis]